MSEAREARRDGVASARARTDVLFISDQPERFKALRASALGGRMVHIWLDRGARAPRWSSELRGDPTDEETYAPLAGREAIVIIDLARERLAQRIADTVCRALPLPAVLVIDRENRRRHADVRAGITWIDEGELLADAIEVVLRRVATRRRVRGLRRAMRGAKRCAFLVQNDPDPDAIASALALRRTLGYPPRRAPIITMGQITRPENQRLIEELGEHVRHVEREELERFAPLVLVDVQPPYFGDSLPEVAAVIDHHPSTGSYQARYRDVRTSYGASATMAAEYLIAEEGGALTKPLATALLYGIITDTKSLSRAASDEDTQMFAYLFPRADHAALRRIQHPSYGRLALRRFGQALEHAHVEHGLAYVHLGRLPAHQEHIVAQLAEFCLGMAGATVSAVSGVFGTRLVMSTRALSADARLGDRLRTTFGRYGSAGGHRVMAKAVLRLSLWRRDHPSRGDHALARTVHAALLKALTGTPPKTDAAIAPVSSLSGARARR